MATDQGRHEEGVELLRNAMAAANLVEDKENHAQLNTLQVFIPALFETNAIDELEPLVPRYREAALAHKSHPTNNGRLGSEELRSLYFSARLHEVSCPLVPCEPPSHCLARVCH